MLGGRPCVVRLHSIEALQTDFPAQVDWGQVTRLVTVSDDIAAPLAHRVPAIPKPLIIPNGIDLARFPLGTPSRFRIAWVGHIEPKKNPMLLLQIAHRLHQVDPRFTVHVAGAFTDLRTLRYVRQMVPLLSVTIENHSPEEIAVAAAKVFGLDGYMDGPSRAGQLVFQKQASRATTFSQEGLYATQQGAQTVNRVKLEVVPLSGGSACRLQCQAYIVRDAGALLEDEVRLSGLRSGPYQSLLNQVKKQLK